MPNMTEVLEIRVPEGVRPTQYGRPDGKVVAIEVHAGEWVLRCIRGPAWFWNFTTKEWVICLNLDMNTASFTKHYIRSEEEALIFLPTLEPVS